MDAEETTLIAAGSAKDTSFIDTIVPNIDYYYIARFRDIHGKISNPTEVYKIKMIHEQGSMPYMITDTIDLKALQKKQHDNKFLPVKKMQKYLYIKPNYLQTNISVVGDEELDSYTYANYPVELGNPNAAVFGRKFKFRIISKQTGKAIDLNLTVKEPENVIIYDD